MLSIITSVHNQRIMNVLFHEFLVRHTHHPFELIVVDNHSTDGSREFFKQTGATVIENPDNYSYPYSQNQGLRAARHDVLVFINNDVLVSPDWDQRLLAVMAAHQLEVATCCGIERLEDHRTTKSFKRRWKVIKNFLGLFGYRRFILRAMHRLMYGRWQHFADQRWQTFGHALRNGFVGNTVIMHRSALAKIGEWDERIQAADFDLYFRTQARSVEHGDIRPLHTVLGVFNHHFIRMTLNKSHPAYKDAANLISLDEKWGKDTVARYLQAID